MQSSSACRCAEDGGGPIGGGCMQLGRSSPPLVPVPPSQGSLLCSGAWVTCCAITASFSSLLPHLPFLSHSPSCCWSGSSGRRACSWTRPRLQPNSCHQAAEPTLVRDQQPLNVRECKVMCTEPGREPLPLLLAAGLRLFSISGREPLPLLLAAGLRLFSISGREPLPLLLAAGSRLFSIFSSNSKRSSKSLHGSDGEGSAHHHQRSAHTKFSVAGPASASKGEASGRRFPSTGEPPGARGGTFIGEDLVRPRGLVLGCSLLLSCSDARSQWHNSIIASQLSTGVSAAGLDTSSLIPVRGTPSLFD